MRFMISLTLCVASAFYRPLAFGEEGCKYDMQCKGERICVKGVCTTPHSEDIFPSSSIPKGKIIKTTRKECMKRGGIDIDESDKDLVRCLVPRE